MKKVLVALLLFAPAVQAKTFEHCGIRFDYPDAWTVAVSPRGIYGYGLRARCVVGLRPPGWLRYRKKSPFVLDAYPVAIRLIDRPFLEARGRSRRIRSGPSVVRGSEGNRGVMGGARRER